MNTIRDAFAYTTTELLGLMGVNKNGQQGQPAGTVNGTLAKSVCSQVATSQKIRHPDSGTSIQRGDEGKEPILDLLTNAHCFSWVGAAQVYAELRMTLFKNAC
ncbi:hypothetical protein OIDMADRAFT_35866 [Oidiodendron maius Zn]|uniref:Uncharacterized protein n=1 Tax=Oidiodendron maius (strain Zn) TaxID=913774 RepID=A0A0C3GSD6_OIDMZ|nr:hypothetical protein OIDMADRAFT_35866 [Oidiodendron maius Zn]